VAVLIDVDVDEATPKLYDVSAMPTLVIAEADGTEVSKSVGAPFSAPEDAIKWFDEIGGKITAYRDSSAKWDESKHTDTAAGEKLAEAAMALGKTAQAIEIYQALIAAAGDDKTRAASLHLKLAKMFLEQFELETATEHVDKADKLTPAEGDARVDVDVLRARLLLFNDKPEEARKLAQKYFDTLLEKVDVRVIDLAEVILGTEDQEDEVAAAKTARAMYQKLAKAFDKHERVWELKVYAAWYGISSGEKEACLKELQEVAEKGEGSWKAIAKSVLDGQAEKEAKEDGEGEKD
jgi:tetratricopeptide (TPR) repeat protein